MAEEKSRLPLTLRHDMPPPRSAWRKAFMFVLMVVCFVLAAIGGLIPILQGWIFLVIGLYIAAAEFETAQAWIKAARRRWPGLSARIRAARAHRWAPRHLAEFDRRTDPDL